MSTVSITDFCVKHNACAEGASWARENCKDMAEVWASAKPEWLVWVATRPGVLTEKELRLFACFCARQHWHLLTDERSRHAVETAERYAEGDATDAELADAADAAWEAAARSAARSAAGAAAARSAAAAAAGAVWSAVWAAWSAAGAAAARSAAGAVWSAVWAAAYLRANCEPNFEEGGEWLEVVTPTIKTCSCEAYKAIIAEKDAAITDLNNRIDNIEKEMSSFRSHVKRSLPYGRLGKMR